MEIPPLFPEGAQPDTTQRRDVDPARRSQRLQPSTSASFAEALVETADRSDAAGLAEPAPSTSIAVDVTGPPAAVKSPRLTGVEYATPQARSAERPLQLVVLGLLALLAYVLGPVLPAIVLGGFVVLCGYAPFEWLVARLRGRRRLATLIATSLVLCAVLVPIALLGYLTIREAAAGIDWSARQIKALGGLTALAGHVPRALAPYVEQLTQRGSSELGALGTRVASMTPEILGAVGIVFAQIFLALVTAYYLFRDGPSMVGFLRRISPLRPVHTEEFIVEFRKVALGLFWGNLFTALFHGIAGGIGYWLCGVPEVFFLGAITMLASFIPALGTAVIWIPIAVVLLLSGHTGAGVGLLLWGTIVIGGIDHIARPLISRGRMRLPNLLVFLTLFGGIAMFGLKGLVLGPLCGSLAVTGLRLLARERTRLASP
jgi:predicted PurR-regulated permease PerM